MCSPAHSFTHSLTRAHDIFTSVYFSFAVCTLNSTLTEKVRFTIFCSVSPVAATEPADLLTCMCACAYGFAFMYIHNYGLVCDVCGLFTQSSLKAKEKIVVNKWTNKRTHYSTTINKNVNNDRMIGHLCWLPITLLINFTIHPLFIDYNCSSRK